MEELDYWRLCEELNIVQAALLVVGEDPTNAEYVEGWDVEKRAKGYEAAKTAICGGLRNYDLYDAKHDELTMRTRNAQSAGGVPVDLFKENEEYLLSLQKGSIIGTLVKEQDFDGNGHYAGYIDDTVDVYKSKINVESLKEWLRKRGFTTGFFFPEPVETLDFLDPLNPRYAPKLAATVSAWQAVTDSGSKSPKQALDKWLREHAAEFNLTNDEGKPIEKAIEECSRVANWNLKGGATKTPS